MSHDDRIILGAELAEILEGLLGLPMIPASKIAFAMLRRLGRS